MINKLRTQQITLELPTEAAEVWVRAVLQKVIKNDEYQTVQTVDRFGVVHRQFSDFAMNTMTVYDPVLGAEVTVSGAGLGNLITELVMQWILSDVPGAALNERGDIVKE